MDMWTEWLLLILLGVWSMLMCGLPNADVILYTCIMCMHYILALSVPLEVKDRIHTLKDRIHDKL